MITEDYVSFETAKLLKEKGFPQSTFRCHYIINGNSHYKNFENRCGFGDYDIIAPTLAMAMKWLREKHNIHTNIMYNDRYAYPYEFHIIKQHYASKSDTHRYTTYEECAEKAIKYCLENLI